MSNLQATFLVWGTCMSAWSIIKESTTEAESILMAFNLYGRSIFCWFSKQLYHEYRHRAISESFSLSKVVNVPLDYYIDLIISNSRTAYIFTLALFEYTWYEQIG
jgi:hypothetical protein